MSKRQKYSLACAICSILATICFFPACVITMRAIAILFDMGHRIWAIVLAMVAVSGACNMVALFGTTSNKLKLLGNDLSSSLYAGALMLMLANCIPCMLLKAWPSIALLMVVIVECALAWLCLLIGDWAYFCARHAAQDHKSETQSQGIQIISADEFKPW